ncbi:hypothetical protein ABEX25_27365 [Paenibacillus thiaminolyticus]|uniref:DUF6933 domain-containing protein n=1 Tax=Paenibacillus thiaminolyticus TaxID=49283 RepID=UPI003D2C96F0
MKPVRIVYKGAKFISELKEYLLLEGVKRSLIYQYLFEAGEVSIGKTNAKSVLGTMNEMSFYCRDAEFDHTFDLCAWLNLADISN